LRKQNLKTFDLETKDLVRRAVCRKSASKALPYKSILMMPSHEMLDVKKMIEFRSIKPFNCHITAIERNFEVANKLNKQLNELGFASVEVLNCELYEADLGGRAFDFAYLDTCGKLNEKILNWLATQVQLKTFAPKARISMAFSTPARCKSRLEEDAAQLIEVLGLEAPKLEVELVGFNSEPKAVVENHRVLGSVLKGLLGEPIQSIAYKNPGHAIPMHVFTFQTREVNTGIGKVLKLIEQVGGQADQLTPGVKAAMKRMPELDFKYELVPATLEDLKLTPPKRGRGRPRKTVTEPCQLVQESNPTAPVHTLTWNVPTSPNKERVEALELTVSKLECRIRALEKQLDRTICTLGDQFPYSTQLPSPWD
jgi:hypothetical protein